ncbi:MULTISPECIES: protein-export chaperone SecB [Pseudoalteromonas]|uniref:Preprotein translocase subunit SecB n=1 Tax=Pseudoalteromonas neustonica TaxID=1840331 RepID=A0ABY3F8R9_9GAMM|nr:protein-export chaperone SecB [Pseudoalteromonas neustonica]TVU80208.1 preprotein translocase subunit SecB [Pseudoalteromonas neustonica]
MNIQLCDSRVQSLNISRAAETKDTDGEIVHFSTNFGFKPDLENNYFICFKLVVETPCGSTVDLQYESMFYTDEIISEEFQSSPFAMVNSPAIAYPFLRAYIATLLTLSGFESVVLPTINFQAMYKNHVASNN